MSNTAYFAVLLGASLGMTSLGGCMMSSEAKSLGKYTVYYDPSSEVLMSEDGSVILTSDGCNVSRPGKSEHVDKKQYLVFSPETIVTHYRSTQTVLPEFKQNYIWDDGRPVFALRNPSKIVDAPPPELATAHPVAMQATDRRDRRECNERWRVEYVYQDTAYWLLIPQVVSQNREDPGSESSRSLLAIPAAVGDVVTFPFQYMMVVNALSQSEKH